VTIKIKYSLHGEYIIQTFITTIKSIKMKKQTLITLFSLFCVAAFAQNNNCYSARRARDVYAQATSFVGAFATYNTPIGTKLTATDYSDSGSGFITDWGLGGGVRGAYFFGTNFGIGGTALYNTYQTQGANQLAEGYRKANLVDSCTVLRKGNYTQMGALVGPVFTITTSVVSIDIHAQGGALNTTLPETSVFFDRNASPALLQKQASAWGFAWQAGLGLRIHFSENVSMGIHADYLNTTPEIKLDNTADAVFFGRKSDVYTQNMSSINAGLGLYYNFAE
jgi:opacity protein-like surface antigen